jgi:hypothetical protein
MKQYTFKLASDKGIATVTLNSDDSITNAVTRVMAIEGCPECAILSIEIENTLSSEG